MICVAFFLNFSTEYKGGINYLKNLFIAIEKVEGSDKKLLLFVPKNISKEYINLFSPYCTIIETNVIKRNTIPWLIDKVLDKLISFRPFTELLIKKHSVKVLSHSYYVPRLIKVNTINWIPDFQYLHYPNLWTKKQLVYSTNLFSNLIVDSDKIILSSNDSFNDFKSIHPEMEHKVEVINFVSQPQQPLATIEFETQNAVIKKYDLEGVPFFYLPNQFWEHKNHLTVFKACKYLVSEGYAFQLITSGYMKDYRSGDNHIANLINYVKDNGLEKTIKFLELIPYEDVFGLIINTNALINPSYFEGWSSTVEEAKSVGTLTLLSDIPVHREQNPVNAQYFNPDEPSQLAQLMKDVLTGKIIHKRPSISFLQDQLDSKTVIFGQKYISLVKSFTNE